MVDSFRKIVITEPDSPLTVEQEASYISELICCSFADVVHIRKPGDKRRARGLMSNIAPEYFNRIRVHYFPELAREFGTGYHCADGEEEPWPGCTHSCHRVEDLAAWPDAPYLFLSPVFPSISKPGYRPKLQMTDLLGKLSPGRVVALGGVTLPRMLSLRRMGFAGGAMMGYIWNHVHAGTLGKLFRSSAIIDSFRLQSITSAPTAVGTVRQVEEAVRGGCTWVQVRMKDAPESEVRQTVEHVIQVLKADDGLRFPTLIVDDYVNIAAGIPEVAGVHLGHADMPRQQAREILGPDKIIGSTANTVEEALSLAPVSDYLGVGPYRFTSTKKNLAPLLGVEGISAVTRALIEHDMPVPVVGIGGIRLSDVPELLAAGVQGVAVSGAIHAAPDPCMAAREFIETLKYL